MLVYSDFFLYKTVWAMGQLLRELPSSLVWVFFLCRHSLQCLTAFRECLEVIARKKGQIAIESMEVSL